jgi:hypothetical protein
VACKKTDLLVVVVGQLGLQLLVKDGNVGFVPVQTFELWFRIMNS